MKFSGLWSAQIPTKIFVHSHFQKLRYNSHTINIHPLKVYSSKALVYLLIDFLMYPRSVSVAHP